MRAPMIANALGAADLLETLLETADRVRRVRDVGNLSEDELAIVRSLDETTERMIAIVEDLVDAQELEETVQFETQQETVAWEELRARFFA